MNATHRKFITTDKICADKTNGENTFCSKSSFYLTIHCLYYNNYV